MYVPHIDRHGRTIQSGIRIPNNVPVLHAAGRGFNQAGHGHLGGRVPLFDELIGVVVDTGIHGREGVVLRGSAWPVRAAIRLRCQSAITSRAHWQ